LGSNGLITKESPKVEFTSLTTLFEEQCPIYMSYGMTYNEFWYGSAYMTYFYRKSHRLKLKEQDENNWMLSVYMYEVLLDVSPILHAFSKKGTKPLPFRDKPILMDKIVPKEKTEEEIEQEVENERLKAIVNFNNWYHATRKRFNKE